MGDWWKTWDVSWSEAEARLVQRSPAAAGGELGRSRKRWKIIVPQARGESAGPRIGQEQSRPELLELLEILELRQLFQFGV